MHRRERLILVTGLTLARFPLIMLFLVLALANVYAPTPALFWGALAAMLFSGLTDLFDGLLARRWGIVTVFGAHADPLMDKLYYAVVFPLLVFLAALRPDELGHAAFLVVMTVAFLSRDLWVTFLRAMGSLYGQSGKAGWSGKVRTAYTFPMLAGVYAYLASPRPWVPLFFVLAAEGIGFLINAWSIVDYTRRYGPALARSLVPEH